MLPKMSAYRRYFDETIFMFFFFDKLLKSWYKVSHAIKDLIVNMYTVKDI